MFHQKEGEKANKGKRKPAVPKANRSAKAKKTLIKKPPFRSKLKKYCQAFLKLLSKAWKKCRAILSAWGKWLKKHKKGLIITAVTVVAIPIAINVFIIAYASQYIVTAEEAKSLDADCAISLGALVRGDSLSPVLEDRTQGAINLYESGAARKVLFSGDHGRENYDEVNAMRKFAEKQDVPSEDVFLDHAGFSTYETMYRAKNVFCADKVIISTQKFHMARSIFLARMMGIEAYGVTCDVQDYGGSVLRDNSRESLARVKDFFTGIFQSKPAFTGDEYPISGSGVVTHDEAE